MKKVLIILSAILITACGKEEPKIEPVKKLLLIDKEISLRYSENKDVRVSVENINLSDVDYKVRDEFVATATTNNDGYKITARHIGETYLVLTVGNLKDSCKITVTPTDIIIEEPIVLQFGLNKESVKSKESRKLINESDNMLRYEIDKYNTYYYFFKDDKLYLVERWAGNYTFSQSDNILTEMYEYVKVENGILYKKGDLWVKLTRSQGGASQIWYSNDSKILANYENIWN
jgi:hypothetical protein